jgi:hypothetical protein
MQSTLRTLVEAVAGARRAEALIATLELPEAVVAATVEPVDRATLAWAMNVLLLDDVLRRVPEGALYVEARRLRGERVVFDHGAIRTVDGERCGALPRGWQAFRRILEPLGYAVADPYPLPALRMTGRAMRHLDQPELMPQFFLSELHVDRFDGDFAEVVERVIGTSVDPLPPRALEQLDRLRADGSLPLPDALALLPDLVACFDRQHGAPSWADYQALLERSAEMAWIASEGNAFNHATDRVPDVLATSARVAGMGVAMKESIETSASGRVLQTATRATTVLRPFAAADGSLVLRAVPGSFFEFITRKEEAPGQLDLRFDAGNATAIFKMTDALEAGA